MVYMAIKLRQNVYHLLRHMCTRSSSTA